MLVTKKYFSKCWTHIIYEKFETMVLRQFYDHTAWLAASITSLHPHKNQLGHTNFNFNERSLDHRYVSFSSFCSSPPSNLVIDITMICRNCLTNINFNAGPAQPGSTQTSPILSIYDYIGERDSGHVKPEAKLMLLHVSLYDNGWIKSIFRIHSFIQK